MSADERDPIFDSLDRLAGLADSSTGRDRMPDIQRRVRQSRRRRHASVGVAAALLVVAGVGVWQARPPSGSNPLPAPPHDQFSQHVRIEATLVSGDHVRLTITVEGTSTSYADDGGIEPIPAGPQSIAVLIDGDRVKRLAGAGGRCEAGGEVSSYSLNFPSDRELQISVGDPGRHTIEVHAPYCADGELVDDPTTVEVTTEADPPTVTEVTADVDGDGSPDTARLSVPAETSHSETMQVSVDWASGGSDTVDLPFSSYPELLPGQDLDGDGAAELIVSQSGGDSAWWDVLRAIDGRLVHVRTTDESGAKASLSDSCIECGGGPLNEFWVTTLLDDGFYDYRFVDAQPPATAPVELRRWVLSGDTMTRLIATAPGCFVRFQGISPGAC